MAFVAAAGDINGDGKDALIIGAIGVDSDAGAAYVILDPYSSEDASFNDLV